MASSSRKFHTIDELKLLVAPIAEKYGVGKVYLFGSVARGDYEEDSDYDFCIELGAIDSIFIFSGFFRTLREAVGNEIDLVDTESVGQEFLNTILKEGVIIYEG
jgi:predicted nucleotidyltransferase